MNLKKTTKKIYHIAFRGDKEGLCYLSKDKKGYTLKTIIECLSEGFILYAAISEVTFKIIGFLSVSVPYALGRLISIPLGLIVCGFAIFSHEKHNSKKYYIFARPSRLIAIVMFPLLLVVFVSTLIDVWGYESPMVISPFYIFSLEINRDSWFTRDTTNISSSEFLVFSLDINIPYTVGKFKHLKFMVEPLHGYKLADVSPQARDGMFVPREQEPHEIGEFTNTRSEWWFFYFDRNKQWKITVRIKKEDKSRIFPKLGPLKSFLYFY